MKNVSGRRLILLVFCAGVLGGTLLANLLPGSYLSVLSELAVDIGDMLDGFSGRDAGYFVYLLKVRLIPLLVLWASLFSPYAGECFCVAAGWYGICTGAVISGAVLLYGAGGILLFLAMILPQYLFYGLIFLQLLIRCERNGRGRQAQAFMLSEEVSALLVMAVLFLMGILLEAYLNPIFLRLAAMVV